MQKISSYLYPNRVQLLADLAGFPVEFTNVYQRTVKIYKGIDNVIEFDIKNADQKRIDLSTLTNIRLNVMDSSGKGLPNSPYTVTPLDQTTLKGIAKVTVPSADLTSIDHQFLSYSVTALKGTDPVILYGDTRFGALGSLELVSSIVPVVRAPRVFDTFTAEVDLSGHPTYHSSAIPVTFYESTKTTTQSVAVTLSGFTGSIWIEGTKNSTLNTEAWKGATTIVSQTYDNYTGTWAPAAITLNDYQYIRVSYTTPVANGVGAQFTIVNTNGVYSVQVRFGGTGYAIGSQIKVFGSEIGGSNVTNDLIITVASLDQGAGTYPSSYSVSSIRTVSWSGTAPAGNGTYIATGKNITGSVDKVTVS